MIRHREIRDALDEATTVTGALRDAMDEATRGDGSLAMTRAIATALERANAHVTRLASTVLDARDEWAGRLAEHTRQELSHTSPGARDA